MNIKVLPLKEVLYLIYSYLFLLDNTMNYLLFIKLAFKFKKSLKILEVNKPSY